MPADDRFVTRAYRPGDETAILDLFARCFHAPRTLEHFRWKYLQNPYGNAHISLTFDGDGRLVGQYAGYPVPFVEGGRDLMAHHIGDIMTDPSVRHVGLGSSNVLARTAFDFYDRFCEGKIAFNYGFNTASHRALSVRFLRADAVEPVSFWRRQLPLKRIARASRWARGYQLEVAREAGAEFDRLFERVAPAYRFLLRRDARYLRWRHLDCPDLGIFVVAIRKWRRLVGWSAFRIRGKTIVWGDALFDPQHPEAVDVLLRHVVPSHPVEWLEAWCAPHALSKILKQEPEPQDLSVMCVPFTLPDATERMRQALYYTIGDSDLF